MANPYVAPRVGDIDYDTEFWHHSGTTTLISVGAVRADGATYYAIDASLPWDQISAADSFVRDHVLIHLPQRDGRLDLDHPDVKPRTQIKAELLEFAKPATEHGLRLWAACGAYDHVVLGTLMGPTLMDWPGAEGWPYFSHDLYQELGRAGLTWSDLPEQKSGEHNALADARHLRVQRQWLTQQTGA